MITQREKRLLDTTHKAMLRRIAGSRRAPDDDWIDWMKRSTRKTIASARDPGIRFWHEAHLKSKWCWAGHVQRMTRDKLANRASIWRNAEWQSTESSLPSQLLLRRPYRTHWFRWEDELQRLASSRNWKSWGAVPQIRDSKGQASAWLALCDAFAKFTRR